MWIAEWWYTHATMDKIVLRCLWNQNGELRLNRMVHNNIKNVMKLCNYHEATWMKNCLPSIVNTCMPLPPNCQYMCSSVTVDTHYHHKHEGFCFVIFRLDDTFISITQLERFLWQQIGFVWYLVSGIPTSMSSLYMRMRSRSFSQKKRQDMCTTLEKKVQISEQYYRRRCLRFYIFYCFLVLSNL